MIKANFKAYSSYVVDSLNQWDLNQVLEVTGLNLTAAPEVHFSNANVDRAIVRQSTMEKHVVRVNIPNSLLQDPLRIYAHIGVYEGKTFKVVELVEIPVQPRKRPQDYQIEDTDEEVYSFKRLENLLEDKATKAQVANILANVGSTAELVDVRYGADGKTYDSAGEAVRAQGQSIIDMSEWSANLYNAENDTAGYIINETGDFVASANFKYSELIKVELHSALTIKSAAEYGGADGATYMVKYYKNPDTGNVAFNGRVNVYGDETYTTTAEGFNLIRLVSSKDAEPFMVNAGETLRDYTPYGVRVVYRASMDYAFAEEFEQIERNTVDIADLQQNVAVDVWVDVADNVESGGVVTDGNVGAVVPFDVVSSAGWRHAIIKCNKGEKFKIAGTAGDKYRLWSFTDDEGVMVSKSAGSITAADLEILAPADGYLILNFSTGGACKVEKVPTINETAGAAAEAVEDIERISGRGGAGVYPFGVGVDCKYEAPEIEALQVPADKLAYFYGLYDALVAQYPGYVSKIDCDAGAVGAGISYPSHMTDYPIYMYKFAPVYTPNDGDLDASTTSANKLKVFIVSGTHPEYISMFDLYQTMRLICEEWQTDDNLDALRWECEFYIMPCSGSWCVQNTSRTNYNGVNLNRNMPTRSWVPAGSGTTEYSGASAGSEYENQVLMHYFDQIAPHVFIDHHNTNVGDHKNLMYITSVLQSCVDVGANHISAMTRRWKQRFSDVFPMDDVIYGFSRVSQEKGLRSEYACEHGAFGFTYESQDSVVYNGGVLDVENAQRNTTLCTTLATDGMVNFLLKVLKTVSMKIV